MSENFTHKQLCEKAVIWLKRPNCRQGPGCSFAFSETAPQGADEIPDAIGWKHGISTLVEVKTSRSDFFADKAKPHRVNPETGLGVYRYFFTTQGLLKIEELPPKWGLVEISNRGVIRPIVGGMLLRWREEDNWQHSINHASEIAFLARILARVENAEQYHEELKRAQSEASRFMNLYNKIHEENKKLKNREWMSHMKNLEVVSP